MYPASGDRRSRVLIALILAPAVCGAPLASSEIFKCVEKGGLERYQNFPCSIDSLGSLPSSPSPPVPAVRTGIAGEARPNAVAGSLASKVRLANADVPHVGMTREEVTAIWGEPVDIDQDERREGRSEIWRYADGRSVQFNNKYRALALQR